MVAKNC